MALTRNRLRNLLWYDPHTGKFTWLETGLIAGAKNASGYIIIGVDGRKYYAHRLAWFWALGYWPLAMDHINCKPWDNRWKNLRVATKCQNAYNRGHQKNNSNKLKGAYRCSDGKHWFSTIQVRGESLYLGCFDTKFKAHAAYVQAAKKHHKKFAHFTIKITKPVTILPSGRTIYP